MISQKILAQTQLIPFAGLILNLENACTLILFMATTVFFLSSEASGSTGYGTSTHQSQTSRQAN